MIGIYLSGTGNTETLCRKTCNLIDDKSKCVPLENFLNYMNLLKKRGLNF